MEQLRAWTLSFCFACIVAGLLGQFSIERKRFSVIKLVLALYILTAALVPLRSGEGVQPPRIVEAAQTVAAPDTGALVLAQAEQQLAGTIGQALAQAGIEHRAVSVRLTQGSETVEVERVCVTAAPEQENAVRQTVRNVIGADVPVVLQEEGS